MNDKIPTPYHMVKSDPTDDLTWIKLVLSSLHLDGKLLKDEVLRLFVSLNQTERK